MIVIVMVVAAATFGVFLLWLRKIGEKEDLSCEVEPPTPLRTYCKWDTLLDHEKAAVFTESKCPDCGSGLLNGPSGGISINVKCDNEDCGSKFNVTPMLVLVERISDAAPNRKLPKPELPGHHSVGEYR